MRRLPRVSGRVAAALVACLLVVVAVVARLPLVIERVTPATPADTVVYFAVADEIGDGNLFFRDVAERPPGYALFVLSADILPLSRELAVVLAQHLLGVALIVAAFLFSWRVFGLFAGCAVGAIMATSPVMVVIEDDTLPDVLFGVFVTAAAMALAAMAIRGSPTAGKAWPAAVGALIGATALVKPIGQVLVLAPLPALAFAGWRGRTLARDVVIIAGVFLAVIGPWVVDGLLRHGSPSLSPQGSLTLFNRVYEVDRRPIPVTTDDGRAVARAVAAHPELRVHAAAFETLMDKYSDDSREALSAMGSLAREGIADYPLTYAWNSVRHVDRFLIEAKSEPPTDDWLLPRAGVSTTVSESIWKVGQVLSDLWWIVALHGLSGLAAIFLGSRQSRVAAMALLSVWALVALATVASHGGLPRYSIALAPITWMLTVAGAAALVSAVLAGSARWRPESHSASS